MAVKIRLRRTGAKNCPCFRVVATDTRFPRDGRFLEVLGWYDPKLAGANFNLKLERVEHWVGKGAVVSDTVRSLIRKARTGAQAPAGPPPKTPAAEPPPAPAAPSEAAEPAAAAQASESAEPVAEAAEPAAREAEARESGASEPASED
ncbi:MAG: 30S ribosomal protein S16 [Kiritimatiellae bacterium]|nr:30S ribosomal protein S16 [Kiritimatiellia bacterium]